MARDLNYERDDDYEEDDVEPEEENDEEEELDEPSSHRSRRRTRKAASGSLDD